LLYTLETKYTMVVGEKAGRQIARLVRHG